MKSSKQRIQLSFLIPAYNDEASIAKAVLEAQRIGKEVASEFEILVINDASADSTKDVLAKLVKAVPQLVVSTHKYNVGYGETMKELYYKGKYEWLFSIPGDYQIPAREVKKLLPYSEKADMIIGLRVHRIDSPARLKQSGIYNALIRVLFGLTTRDINSVRLMRKSLVQSLTLESKSAFVDAQLTIVASQKGLRIIEVPIGHNTRQDNQQGGGGKWHIILPTIVDMVLFRLRTLFS